MFMQIIFFMDVNTWIWSRYCYSSVMLCCLFKSLLLWNQIKNTHLHELHHILEQWGWCVAMNYGTE